MTSLVFDIVIPLALGVWMVLLGFGFVTINRDPEKSAAWHRQWGRFMKIAGPLVILWGLYNLVRFAAPATL